MAEQNVTERAQYLLKILIEKYIKDGQPVGSKTLAEDSRLALSSASIRNIMSDLEERGYLCSPHTSAGRIPTSLGYRFFVDSLLTVQEIDDVYVKQYKEQLTATSNMRELINSASSFLSNITQLAGVVTMPKPARMTLRQVEFITLSANRILVILVLNEKDVQNRIIQAEREYKTEELQQVANFVNDQYAGKDLMTIRDELIKAMHEDRHQMEQMMQIILDVTEKAFTVTDKAEDDMVVKGQDNLLGFHEDNDLHALKSLFEAFAQKREILHIFDKCLNAQRVQIYIGEESGYNMLGDYSIVTAPYMTQGKCIGALGVIGPLRMSYERVIPMVDVTAKLISAFLNDVK